MGIGTMLPRVSSNLLAGLWRRSRAAPYNGKADLPRWPPTADGDRRAVPGRRDAADAALRRAGGRRHQADRDAAPRSRTPPLDERKRISRGSCSPTCRSPRTSAGCWTSAPRTWRAKSRFPDELEDYMTPEAAEEHAARGHQLGPLRRAVRVRRREARASASRTRLSEAADHSGPRAMIGAYTNRCRRAAAYLSLRAWRHVGNATNVPPLRWQIARISTAKSASVYMSPPVAV